ncbi:MAG: hypothetical protein ABR567_15590 [Myxococcales bacterium]|nr:hypothetical protein [Myxococcales bacterium]
MAGDHKGDIDNHGIAANEGDLPKGVIEKAEGGMEDRGGQAGPGVGGSGVHGMQDKDNTGPLGQDGERGKRPTGKDR